MTANPAAVAVAAAKLLAKFDEYAVQIIVLTRLTKKKPPELFRLNITTDLAARFRSMAHRVGTRLQERTLVHYDVGRLLAPHEMIWLDAQSSPLIQSIADAITHPEDLPLLDPRSDAAKRMRVYFVRIVKPEGDVVFFNALTASALLVRANKIPAIFTRGTYDTLRDAVIVFDPRFDGAIVNDIVFTTKKSVAESLLGIVAEIRAQATETFDQIAANLRIANIDQFRNAVTADITMMRKMSSIAEKIERNPTYLDAMAMDKILTFVRKRPHIEIDVEGQGRDARFVFHNDPQRRWRILHLLDDDYLHSPLTELEYEANSKSLLE